jgi:hypothetical protein
VMLPPGGKRVRVVVCGKPLLPGYLTLLGVRFTMSGVTWTQPLLPLNLRALPSAGSSAPSTDGRSLAVTGAGAGAAGGGGSSSASRLHALPPLPLGRGRDAKHAAPPRELLPVVHILPSLPLLRASLDVPGGPPVVVPTEEEVHPAASTSAASSGAQGSLSMSARPSALNVWEGQVTRWALTLTNLSTIPVSSCTITVTNSKVGTALHFVVAGISQASCRVRELKLACCSSCAGCCCQGSATWPPEGLLRGGPPPGGPGPTGGCPAPGSRSQVREGGRDKLGLPLKGALSTVGLHDIYSLQ